MRGEEAMRNALRKEGKATKAHRPPIRPGRIALYAVLCVTAVLLLLPIVLTFLYSFFPPKEMGAYLKTRNNYQA